MSTGKWRCACDTMRGFVTLESGGCKCLSGTLPVGDHCEACPGGQELVGTRCLPICPAGTTRKLTTRICVPNPKPRTPDAVCAAQGLVLSRADILNDKGNPTGGRQERCVPRDCRGGFACVTKQTEPNRCCQGGEVCKTWATNNTDSACYAVNKAPPPGFPK